MGEPVMLMRTWYKIYIIGFSRGAVIARLVAGLISTFGVLKPENVQFFGNMWNHAKGAVVNEDVIKRYCYQDIPIEFLGLFDTVPGKLERREADILNNCFRDRMLPRKVKNALHILAMREARLELQPILFKGVEDAEEQHLEQMWMPGVHSDIGGGYTQDLLGNNSLLTMLDRLQQKTALNFDEGRLSKLRTSIWDDLESEKVVINNELGSWWQWPLSRIYGKFGRAQRKPRADSDQVVSYPQATK